MEIQQFFAVAKLGLDFNIQQHRKLRSSPSEEGRFAKPAENIHAVIRVMARPHQGWKEIKNQNQNTNNRNDTDEKQEDEAITPSRQKDRTRDTTHGRGLRDVDFVSNTQKNTAETGGVRSPDGMNSPSADESSAIIIIIIFIFSFFFFFFFLLWILRLVLFELTLARAECVWPIH